MGATNIFIHTTHGEEVFIQIKGDFVCSPSDINPVIKRDGVIIKNCVPKNLRRAEFFKDLNTLPIEVVERKYLSPAIIKRSMAALKPWLYKLGVFTLYMKLKKRLKQN